MTATMSSAVLDRLRMVGDPVLHESFWTTAKSDLFHQQVRKRGLLAIARGEGDNADIDRFIDHLAWSTFDQELALPGGGGVDGDGDGDGGDGPGGGDEGPEYVSRLEIDRSALRRSADLFATFGTEIAGALLLAALPQAYAAEWGASVLLASGGLNQGLQRRVQGTAQFLAIVTQHASSDEAADALWVPPEVGQSPTSYPHPPPWRMCTVLRLYHESIRRYLAGTSDLADVTDLPADRRKIMNQEDLLGTLLTFTVSVFEVLEQFGLAWDAGDQDAYLHTWDVVGAYLGIGSRQVIDGLDPTERQAIVTWPGVRPPSREGTRDVLDLIRSREWMPTTPGSQNSIMPAGRSGRLLVRALLDLLADAMPRRTRGWPLDVMRQLAPPVVSERLGLGAPGVVMASLGALPGRRVTISRFTDIDKANPANARVTRAMANEVTRRAMIHFVAGGDFVIPGLYDWTDGFAESRA
jgi:hypothetical protein